jgi:hypothetical protein
MPFEFENSICAGIELRQVIKDKIFSTEFREAELFGDAYEKRKDKLRRKYNKLPRTRLCDDRFHGGPYIGPRGGD